MNENQNNSRSNAKNRKDQGQAQNKKKDQAQNKKNDQNQFEANKSRSALLRLLLYPCPPFRHRIARRL